MPETCDEFFFDPQNPLFCIKDKKNLYIQNVGHIWAYIHANSQDFWKSFNGSDKTKHVKKCGKKNAKQYFFLNPFLGHFQKSETGFESMCRFVMASSFQKWS